MRLISTLIFALMLATPASAGPIDDVLDIIAFVKLSGCVSFKEIKSTTACVKSEGPTATLTLDTEVNLEHEGVESVHVCRVRVVAVTSFPMMDIQIFPRCRGGEKSDDLPPDLLAEATLAALSVIAQYAGKRPNETMTPT